MEIYFHFILLNLLTNASSARHGITRVREVDLFSAAWVVRHGAAAMAMRERAGMCQCGGSFSDFVSDQVRYVAYF